MKRLAVAIAAAMLSSSAMAAGPCDQYAYYVDTLAGRQIVYTPTYQKCMEAQWAGAVGKAAGFKSPNLPEVIAPSEEQIKRREAQDAEERKRRDAENAEAVRKGEMYAKFRAINKEYNQKEAKIGGVIGALYNAPEEKERNEKLTAVANEYGYDWDKRTDQFTKKTQQQIDERARELEFISKVKEIKAQYPPTSDQSADARRLKERNDKVLALANEYGYEWNTKTGQFFNPKSNNAAIQ